MIFSEAGLFLCYMNYYAPGECVRSCIAVAGSAQRAEQLIKDKLPEYFYAGLVTTPINQEASEDVIRMIKWMPPQVKNTLGKV